MIEGAARALPASASTLVLVSTRQRGFTLLEMLAVVVIIAIMVTFSSLSIGNRPLDDRLEAESKRIEQLLRLAEDEADLKGIAIGLAFTPDGYRFLIASSASKWDDYAQSGSFRSRPLLQPFYSELRIEGRLIPPIQPKEARSGSDSKSSDDDDKKEDEATKLKPQVLLLPGGQMTPFTLDLKAPNYPVSIRIEGNLLGQITRERHTVEKAVTR
ncbi:type II secretion system minor pseudopilin GspH [Nevskia ramosa]|uniref:type II secretion system minor pseudopilin GspH n=1 Tax=Nevskia ramosa TaxID=64002 RepID=UPI00345041F6